MKIDTCTN